VEKKQYELCLEIFKRFHDAGILDNLILVGSWCLYFYKDYFVNIPYIKHIDIKTRDIDFLLYEPAKITRSVDIPSLLQNLGFIVTLTSRKGYIRLEHPELLIEFLVSEKGRGIDAPYPLPKLGINAVALRFVNILSDNIIRVNSAFLILHNNRGVLTRSGVL